ncbi:MAG TPA: ATP-binding protein [Alphaproteobacteria bacterium]|nr:ATP-binding protein [Alphaproteobacteria bacterium]
MTIKYHRFSIRTLLLIVISILNILIAGPLGYLTYQSFLNYNNAQDIRRISDKMYVLYDIKKYLSQERAAAIALLYAPSASYAALDKEMKENNAQGQGAFERALYLVQDSDKPALRTAIEKVKKSYDGLPNLRRKLDNKILQAGQAQKAAFADEYFQYLTGVNKDIDAVIAAYLEDIIQFDPEIARRMRQTRLIWEISEDAGQEYAILGRLIAQNQYPDPVTREQLITLRGRIKYGLELAEAAVATTRWREQVGPALAEAHTHYLMIFEQVKDVFYEPEAISIPTLYPVSVEMWLNLASEAVNSFHAMTDVVLQTNTQYVSEIEDQATQSIYLSLFLFASALALSFYTWWLITWRVVKPVNTMVEALYKESHLSESDLHDKENLDEITKLEQVLEVFRENTRQLEKERDKAQAANIAKSEFLTNMSHEIRTPMNVVVGLSNILVKSSPLTKKQGDLLRTLQISADSLLSLISDLLDFSKIEAHKFDLERTRFDLAHLIKEFTEVISFNANEKNLVFKTDVTGIEGKQYMGDPTRIRQILVNLCGNAIKFTEKGSVVLKIKTFPNTKPGFETIEIFVTDTGIGIPQDKLETIFEKFTQADTSIVRKYGGTGLGLAITKSLVEMMGGTIEVMASSEKGTTFKVTLILQPKVPQNLPANDEFEGEDKQSERVLLVEDYIPNAVVTGTFLEEFGYDYDIAKSGHEAVRKFMENDYPIVLMDIQMPGMDGYEATKTIRKYEKEAGIPPAKIIGLTAHASPNDREKCLKVGMDDYLAKPFEQRQLKDKLQR